MEKFGKFGAWTLGILVVVGVVLRFTLFEVWTIPNDPVLGAAAAPTLNGGDTVLLLTRGTPVQGDLVRCPDPEKAGKWVIGRLYGLPGDTIDILGTGVTVNGNRYGTSDACKTPTFKTADPDSGTEVEIYCARIEIGGGWHYRGTIPKKQGSSEKLRRSVGTGKVFLLSDNFHMHDDSRDFGNIDQASCNRRVVFRLWGAKGWGDAETRLTVIH